MATISFQTPLGIEIEFFIEASKEITDSATTDITNHPVEKGVNITDHCRPLPRPLTINGIFNDDGIAPFPWAIEKYNQIVDAGLAGALFTYCDDDTLRKNMLMKSITRKKDASTASCITFNIELQEAIFVDSALGKIPKTSKPGARQDTSHSQAESISEPPMTSMFREGYDFARRTR